MHLTKRYIEAARYEGQGKRDVRWDDEPRGLGLRIYPSGEKVFVLSYRLAGKKKLFTLGSYGDDLTLDQAREEASDERKRARRGIDLALDKRQRKVKGETFSAVAARWLRDDQKHNRSHDEAKRIIENHCKPLADKTLGEITKADVLNLLQDTRDGTTAISRKRKGRKGAPYMANRVLSALRRFFNWCVEQDRLPASPVATIKPVAPENERERVLSDAELKLVWECSGAAPYGPLVRMLMLTGARRDEVGTMSRDEIDGETWEIPGARTKNGKPHRIPLTSQAQTLLKDLPKMGGGRLCFTTDGKKPFNGFSKAKIDLDQRLAEKADETGIKIKPWVLHDIRRTVASGLARLGIQPIVISALLNHSPKRLIGITAVYARHSYDREKRLALEAWASRLDAIIAGKQPDSNVLELARA